MYEGFENLPEAKKERILDACMEEFANKGYEGASTNEIVKRAGISKGILFHYFKNKKNLYLYLLDKTIDHTVRKFYSYGENAPDDLFERILFDGMIKLRISYEEPLVYKLIYRTFINTPDDLKDEVTVRYERIYENSVPAFLEGLDLSGIRSGVDPKKAVDVILIFMEGLMNRYTEAYKNIPAEQAFALADKIMDDSREYIDIMKKGIYGLPVQDALMT